MNMQKGWLLRSRKLEKDLKNISQNDIRAFLMCIAHEKRKI